MIFREFTKVLNASDQREVMGMLGFLMYAGWFAEAAFKERLAHWPRIVTGF